MTESETSKTTNYTPLLDNAVEDNGPTVVDEDSVLPSKRVLIHEIVKAAWPQALVTLLLVFYKDKKKTMI